MVLADPLAVGLLQGGFQFRVFQNAGDFFGQVIGISCGKQQAGFDISVPAPFPPPPTRRRIRPG